MNTNIAKGQPYKMPEEMLLSKRLLPDFHDLVQSLIQHPIIERLNRVSFLGTLSILYDHPKQNSRLDHALGCAYLSALLADTLNLSEETAHTLVLFSLLHDIGHTPFSHSVEPLLRDYSNLYHEGASSRLLSRLIKQIEGKDIIASSYLSTVSLPHMIRTVRDLLREEDASHYISNSSVLPLIEGPISIDTLDGIARTAICLGLNCPSVYDIASGFYVDQKGRLRYRHERIELLLDFWKLKDYIYSNYVFSYPNQSGEAMLNRAVELSLTKDKISLPHLASYDDTEVEKMIRENPDAAVLLDQLYNGKVLTLALAPEDISISTREHLKNLARSTTHNQLPLTVRMDFSPFLKRAEEKYVIFHFSKQKSFHITESFLMQPRLFDDDYDVASDFPKIFQANRNYDFVGIFSPPFTEMNSIDRRQEYLELAKQLEFNMRETTSAKNNNLASSPVDA